MREVHAQKKTGGVADVTDDFTALTGIAPPSLQQWLAANKPVLSGFAA